MHEMALAQGILQIALDYAARENTARIGTIGLKIGEMSGVEEESLRTSWHIVSAKTCADGAKLKITRVPLVGRCHLCGVERPVKNYNFWCPDCHNGVLKIISGREMQVEYLEVEDKAKF